MSEDLFYNRDRNLSGFADVDNISSLSLTPVYGSKVDFSAKNHSYELNDSFINIVPLSLNSLSASFKLRYDVNELNAQKLTDFFESKNGVNSIAFNPDNSGIYRSVYGFCDNYAINHMNNYHYEFATEITADQAPTLLNWSGMTFLNYTFQNYNTGQSYKKYDVVYTGVNAVKINNFYYCTGNHSSLLTNSPTGLNSMWTQDFFFEPTIGIQNDVKMKVKKFEPKNSFPVRVKTQDNMAGITLNYKFTNITNAQLKSMLHFLENKAGYRLFRHQPKSVYNRPKVFRCSQWTHTWKYYDSNDLDLSLVEDVLGIIPLDS